MIVVTFALPDESGVFIRHLTGLRWVEKGALPVIHGFLDSEELFILHTGVGLDSARIRLSRFLEQNQPSFLVSSGFAGGLVPALGIGDLIAGTNYSSDALLSAARQFFSNNPRILFGSLHTHRTPAESVPMKLALATESGALAVDMETSAISEVCAAKSIPMLSLRGISDISTQALPIPFSVWFDEQDQRPRPVSLLLFLLFHPAGIPPFIRFVRGVFKAKKILAANLALFLKHTQGTPS